MLINLKLNINNSQLFLYGSGVKRVIRLFKEYGSREPLFEDRLGGMVVVAYRKDPFTTPLEAPLEAPLETTRMKIIELLKENPKYTILDIMSKIDKSRDTIKEHLARLKRDGELKRVGSRKAGYWEVLDA